MEDKSKVFEKELKFIKGDKYREFAIRAIEKLPDYFFTIPASSTGKYHPSYALGEGGLVRHTKAAFYIALELFRMECYGWADWQKDLVLTALLVHDGRKSGEEHNTYTVVRHPVIQADAIINDEELCALISRDDLELLCSMISTHMGQWNTDFKTGDEVMSKPDTPLQKFVHLCDYLASRKCLEFNFDVI
jgi:hypothetical protein